MALTNNPNKTKSIEKKWNREIKNRWGLAWAEIKKLSLNSMIANLDDQEQSEVDIFLASFAAIVNAILLGGDWQNKYQTTAYERSSERTLSSIKSSLTAEEILFISGLIGDQPFFLPENRNELSFLHKRANDSLEGWVRNLIKDTNSIVHDNYGKLNKDELISLIQERFDVTESRARTIATTEITQASQRAVTTQAKIMALTLGKEVGIRWITVRDSKVRHLHASWHGKIFTNEQAERNFNISPWNCRCGLKAVVMDRDPARLRARFAKERKFLLARESKNLVK